MSSFFVNPQLLGLAALVGLPIIIYLINRQRYRRRQWAAMAFLLRALRKNRRRLQLQNLLLLLLRCLVILLLVLAAARPVMRQSGLGVTPGREQNWILVLDTSYSMGWRENSRSLFDQARFTVDRMSESLLRPGDEVALMTFAHSPEVVLGRSPVNEETKDRLAREVEDLQLDARPLRLVPSLRVLEGLVAEFEDPAGSPQPCRIVFFSDLQRRDWLSEDGPAAPEAARILEAVAGRGGEFSVAELGRDDRLNVSLSDLSVKPELVARDVPVGISVSVTNPSDEEARDLDLTLRVLSAEEWDPSEEPPEAQLGELIDVPAGGTVTRPLPYRFDEAGFHVVAAEVRNDGLVLDNRRWLAVPVKEEVRVLVVDGDPALEASERESFFLQIALQPQGLADDAGGWGGRFSPFQPEVVTVEDLPEIDWREWSVVVLANVPDIPEASVTALERWVAEGGALLGFLGDRVRRDFYMDRLWKEGDGLLPLPLEGRRGDPETPVFLQFTSPNHPIARFFEERKATSYLHGGIVSFYRYWRLAEDTEEAGAEASGGDGAPAEPAAGSGDEAPGEERAGPRVLGRFNDLDRSPAIIDNSYGQGRVMWFLSGADRDWNEFPVWQDYVVFLHEALSYLVGFGTRSFNLRVGEPFQRTYGSEEFAAESLLTVPARPGDGLASARTIRRPMREVEGERRFRIVHEDTSLPGMYRLELRRPGTELGDSMELFAVNVDPAEGDLSPMTAADFETHYGIEPALFDASERFRDMARQQEMLRGREYWPWVLGVVLGLLLLETALAQFFGRRAR